ncbi:MAG: extracellular solute-binding protein [Propionibacteriaceae bacterium]|jgi:arabinogalactan oligomer/maltooligosaccharide transport system substrate-binding protein|nr:extracellular solute-binding protein [Propionibacteriaceae bacterium]
MKVRAASFVVAAALALSMGACSTNNGSGTESTAGTSPETTAAAQVTDVTLTVWAPQEDQVDANSWLPKEEAAFEAAHPEYKITWKNSVVSEGDAGKTVQQDPSAAADVYLFANDQLGTLIQAGAIGTLPPASLAQVQGQASDFVLASVTGADGKVYGIPYTTNTWFMYYNKAKFTADDIKSLDAMLAKGKVSFPLDNSWYIASFYMGAGGSLFGATGDDAAAGIKLGDKAADVTAYLANMVANPNFVNDAQGSGLAGIQNGTVDVLFSGSWDAENVKTALGDNYAAAQPPTFTVDGASAEIQAFAGTKAVGFNPKSKNPTAASQFAAFLGDKAAQQDHFTMRGIIPTDKNLATDPAVVADPVAAAQNGTIDNSSILQPSIAEMGDWWTPAENFGKSLLSKEVTVDNAKDKTAAWQAAYGA